ncbi:tyrosinase precursor (monophenol monooxygenase) [Apiospora aurea]|uniref:tyrosinase n=1 Tax=Apiospora aurea TaxID=335848 RepID=A0ABR1PU16_9PEZI
MTPLDELRQANERGTIRGLRDVSGVKERLDIDIMIDTKPDTFNLFILAVKELQKPANENTPDAMRYAELSGEISQYICLLHPSLELMACAGIHGLPQRKWEGDHEPKEPKNKSEYSYCHHGKRTFHVWHRPYVAAMEQSIFLTMLDLATKWKSKEDRDKYTKAAYDFRFPFWDYFRPRGESVRFPGVISDGKTEFKYDYSCPVAFMSEKIEILTFPDDKKEVMDNPLYHYNFEEHFLSYEDWKKSRLDEKDLPYLMKTTRRWPKFPINKDSTTDLNKALNKYRMDSNRLMVRFMTDSSYNQYDCWVSTNKDYDPVLPDPRDVERARLGSLGHIVAEDKPAGSLEDLHNSYHGWIGGDGHMSTVPVAGFDPIFWVHHCQIERLAAIWQAIHKGEKYSWLGDPKERSCELKPFRGRTGEVQWKADDLQDYAILGYTYPEIGIQEDKKKTVEMIHHMYDWSIYDPDEPRPDPSTVIPPDDMKPICISERFFKSVWPPKTNAWLLSLKQQTIPYKSPGPEHGHHRLTPREWYIDSSVKSSLSWHAWTDPASSRNALGSTFSIIFFITENEDDQITSSENAMLLPSAAGVHHVFTEPTHVCENCRRLAREDTVVTSTMPITSKLIDYRFTEKLENLDADAVVPFLKGRLRWLVSAPHVNDEDIHHTDFDFKINITSHLRLDDNTLEYKQYFEIIKDVFQRNPGLLPPAHPSPREQYAIILC